MSDWYALDVIEESIEDTKQLFLPFDLKNWLKMAVVTLFAASGGLNFPNVPSGLGDSLGSTAQSGSTITGNLTAFSPDIAVLGLVVVVLLLGLGWMFVSAVMQFVFVRICAEREVGIRERFSSSTGNGWRLLGFKLAVALTMLAVGGIGGFALYSSGAVPGAVIVGVVGLLLLLLAVGAVMSLTVDFVVVKMIADDMALIPAWKRSWQVFKEEWKQVLVYWLLKIGLGIAVGVVAIMLFVTVLLAFVVGGAVLAIPVYLLYTVSSVAGAVLGVVLGVAVLTVFAAVLLMVNAPLKTFIRYYSLRVYEGLFGERMVS